jgi:hypothetical protein
MEKNQGPDAAKRLSVYRKQRLLQAPKYGRHVKGAQAWDFLVLVFCINHTSMGQRLRLLGDINFILKLADISEFRSSGACFPDGPAQ